MLAILAVLLLWGSAVAAQREPQPKVEVTLGPGTVVFIAAILHGENVEDQEMLPVHYDARFDRIRVPCPEGQGKSQGCTEIRLNAIGFPRVYSMVEGVCPSMEMVGVTFNGRALPVTDPPRKARKKRQSAWFRAGFSVENGATILAAYQCPETP